MAYTVKKTVGTELEILAIAAAQTACAAGIYLSSDTNKLWLGANDGSLIGPYVTEGNTGPKYYGDYSDDDTAGQNGVPLFGLYFLTPMNGYDLPGGSVKKRIEQ